MSRYSRNDLPILGAIWSRFPTLNEAKRFASWAERETSMDEYPCEAFITEEPSHDDLERFEVKVRNW